MWILPAVGESPAWRTSMTPQPDPTESNPPVGQPETTPPQGPAADPEFGQAEELEDRSGGRRWLIAVVLVPLTVAGIGAGAVVASTWMATQAAQSGTTSDRPTPAVTPSSIAAPTSTTDSST